MNNADSPYNTNPVVRCPTWTVKCFSKVATRISKSNEGSLAVSRPTNSPKSSQMKTTHSLSCDDTAHVHLIEPVPALNCRHCKCSTVSSLLPVQENIACFERVNTVSTFITMTWMHHIGRHRIAQEDVPNKFVRLSNLDCSSSSHLSHSFCICAKCLLCFDRSFEGNIFYPRPTYFDYVSMVSGLAKPSKHLVTFTSNNSRVTFQNCASTKRYVYCGLHKAWSKSL